jgi:sodium-dependent phosphate cotransporter
MVSGTIAPLAVALSHLTFNLLGIGLLYPIKRIREIPIRLAEWFSNLATQNKVYPLLYILIVFFLIPLALITLVR